jgi:hypothetical protein
LPRFTTAAPGPTAAAEVPEAVRQYNSTVVGFASSDEASNFFCG